MVTGQEDAPPPGYINRALIWPDTCLTVGHPLALSVGPSVHPFVGLLTEQQGLPSRGGDNHMPHELTVGDSPEQKEDLHMHQPAIRAFSPQADIPVEEEDDGTEMEVMEGKPHSEVLLAEEQPSEQQKKPRRKDTPVLSTPPLIPGVRLMKGEKKMIHLEMEEKDGK